MLITDKPSLLVQLARIWKASYADDKLLIANFVVPVNVFNHFNDAVPVLESILSLVLTKIILQACVYELHPSLLQFLQWQLQVTTEAQNQLTYSFV